MHPDWQTVRRLGLVNTADVQALKPVLALLQQALPTVHITLLTTVPPAAIVTSTLDIPVVLLQSQDAIDRIDTIRRFAFDAAVIFTAPYQSPYALAYLCYLAGIPIRIGQSQEFGGSVLSSCITPPLEEGSLTDYHLHLLASLGLTMHRKEAIDQTNQAIVSSPAQHFKQRIEPLHRSKL